MSDGPWSFDESRDAAAKASRAQHAAEEFIREAARDFAVKEETYRMSLAQRIVELHAEGVAWSSTADLARGDKHVATLRRERDIAEGVREAAVQAAWRRAADRRDTSDFIRWSMRRELAEFDGSDPEEPAEMKSYGTRRAA
jgi:hypothetical protein